MTQTFLELPLDGVLIAPFVLYAAAALIVLFFLRPLFRLVGFDRLFSNPPVAQLCVYICILAFLVAFS